MSINDKLKYFSSICHNLVRINFVCIKARLFIAYEACNRIQMSPHMAKNLETVYITHISHYENISEICGVWYVSFKRFSNNTKIYINNTKMLAKENVIFNFIVYLTKVYLSICFVFKTPKNKIQQMAENSAEII